jgi:hypothetical protein
MFDREVGLAPKGQVEVSIVQMRGKSNLGQDLSADSETLPLLTDVSLRVEKADGLELERTLDTEHDVFLKDHRLDGNPVFPMAMAVELMAEVVQSSWPEWKVTHIRSLQVFRGIVLNDGIRTIRIKARPKTVSSPRKDVLEVDTEITELDRHDRPCYRAVVQLGKQLPTPQRYDHEILSDLGPFPMEAVEAYGRWLFHGPFFQGISRIDGINDHGISGLLVPSSPAQGLANGGNGRWLIDPVLLDSSLQLGILWERAVYDMTPLPSGFSSYCCFDSPPTSSPVQCYVHTRPSVGGHILVADVYYVDDSGRVIGILDQMESSCTKALNRLTESHKSLKGNG